MPPKEKKSLGESLAEEGLITETQLKDAREEEKRTGQRLRKLIVKMGFITDEDLVQYLSTKLGIPRIELTNYLIDPKIIELIPETLARKYEVIPVLKIGNRLTAAMIDPWNILAIDEIRSKTGFIIEPVVATQQEIKKALDQYYGAKGTVEDLIKSIDKDKVEIKEEAKIDIKRLEGIVEEPVVVRLVNLIIMKAIKEGASDIHIEPEESTLRTRLRIDGVLREISSPPKYLQSAIVSRIKIMATLDITERRIAQDGRFHIKMEGRDIDVRVSCVPTIFGENVVLRLLDISSALLSLDELGFPSNVLENYKKIVTRPHGIILVTGPTGCGKTTTLYSSLDKINSPDKNIITIEDPVEYNLAGIRQIHVNPKVNLTFAQGLRSILRQDPDVIMVGEIRDFETAEISIHAALTGHLVFSTLHTNDAAGAITRLVDMGIEPYLISSSVIAILAERLVRTICHDCKEEYSPTHEVLKDLGISSLTKNTKFTRGKGCHACGNTGYRGRIGIFELLLIEDDIRNLIIAKASLQDIRKRAHDHGMTALKDDGIQKIKQGLTTPEEVLRVTEEE